MARLHSGDLSIFSAMGEQLRRLERAGVAYTVTPGVPAFAAAAAALERELTLPGLAQSLVLTRTSGRASPMPERETLANFAATGATLAIHLSIHALDDVVAELTPFYGPDCPAAVVARASWPDERIVRATLGEIVGALRETPIERTALILVGPALGAEDFRESELYNADYVRRFRGGRSRGARTNEAQRLIRSRLSPRSEASPRSSPSACGPTMSSDPLDRGCDVLHLAGEHAPSSGPCRHRLAARTRAVAGCPTSPAQRRCRQVRTRAGRCWRWRSALDKRPARRRMRDALAERRKVDRAALRMQVELALGELGHLRRAAGDGEARDGMLAQIFQQAADKIAHLDQRMIGQAVQRPDRSLGRFAGRGADVGAAAGARDIHATVDRVDPGRARIGI